MVCLLTKLVDHVKDVFLKIGNYTHQRFVHFLNNKYYYILIECLVDTKIQKVDDVENRFLLVELIYNNPKIDRLQPTRNAIISMIAIKLNKRHKTCNSNKSNMTII
jgi:hypothetical protein